MRDSPSQFPTLSVTANEGAESTTTPAPPHKGEGDAGTSSQLKIIEVYARQLWASSLPLVGRG
jgi:hypothetical protein